MELLTVGKGEVAYSFVYLWNSFPPSELFHPAQSYRSILSHVWLMSLGGPVLF